MMLQQTHSARYESKVYSKGKTTLPLEIRNKLGIKDNETIIYIPRGNSYEITTKRLLLEQMRVKLQQPENNYSVDNFISDRHQDALDEMKD
jgi:bifunctional DNA-binding transcriptional regulator/antitoxin component of YhaV-PrlF toxin-antitoxin module